MSGDSNSITVQGIAHPITNAQLVVGLGGPSRFMIEAQLQAFVPPLISDITARYNNTSIVWKQCHLIDPSFNNPPTDVTTVYLTYLDRRWRWVTGGGTFSGRFNLRDAKGSVRSKYKRTPIEIFKAIFGVLKETNVSYEGVNNSIFPTFDWDDVPTYQALTELMRELGVRDALTYDNRIKIVKLGNGKTLPTTDLMSSADSVRDIIAPEFLEISFGPTQLECDLKLEPVGVELGEGEIKDRFIHPNKLSYAPLHVEGPNKGKKGWWTPDIPSASMAPKAEEIVGLAANLLPTKLDEYALADQHIFRTYRITAFGDGTNKIPGDKTGKSIPMERVVPLGFLNERETDDISQFVGAYVYGEHYRELDGGWVWPLWVRVQTGFSIDAENMLVHLSSPVWMYGKGGDGDPIFPNLYLRTCVQLRDSNWGLIRYRFKKPTGSNNKSGTRSIPRPEIIRRITAVTSPVGEKVNRNTKVTDNFPPPSYVRSVGSKFGLQKVIDNLEQVKKQAEFYWNIERLKALPDASGVRTYNCLKKIEPDGKIQQVVVTMSDGVMTTEAAYNSEFHPTTMRYEDRVAMDVAKAGKNDKGVIKSVKANDEFPAVKVING